MKYIQSFQVFPAVPESISFLRVLSRNMWWCWSLDAVELFRRVNPKLWRTTNGNPILFSTKIPQDRLKELATDKSYLGHMERVKATFEAQIKQVPPSQLGYKDEDCIAYFSMEFGIHESLPLFAGGLGVLAGDHLKAASDLGLPLIAVGLLYKYGYFHQYLDQHGWQQEDYPETEMYHLPLNRIKDADGNPIFVQVTGPEGLITAAVWSISVGRVRLVLLDTNIRENPPNIRDINSRLYAAELKIRLSQELLLGIGGLRALEAMGIFPTVCHMNEGHSAFVSLERLAQTMRRFKVDLKTALEIVPRTNVFTTHTPVAAGHDEFQIDLLKSSLMPFQETLGTNIDTILGWGRENTHTPVSMFVLAARLSQYINGVSELHGKVARSMWNHIWQNWPKDDVPISHITNGVHIASWISIENTLLFERYLGPEWYMREWGNEITHRIDEIYDEELWRAHEMSRARLIRACRELMVRQYAKRNAPKHIMREVESVLEQDALTIVFARRFATYKRANLILRDPERLERLITNKERPVQFIFAGKAHPQDNAGKELIKALIQFAQRPKIRHKFIFLEDYDINMARRLVQGADVWLNNPRRPLEACGTSGMKAAVNGVLNLSILDGWWCEGYRYSNTSGFKIGNGDEYTDHAYQDEIESQALYNILEDEVIPCFYDRKNGDAPNRWLKMIKESMKMAMKHFSANIMVKQYHQRFYTNAAKSFQELIADDSAKAKRLNIQRERLVSMWNKILIEKPARERTGAFLVGEKFEVTCKVHLGDIKPEEIDVELYFGVFRQLDVLETSQSQPMKVKENLGNGIYLYSTAVDCIESGRYGYTVRVIPPKGDDRLRFTPNLITWASA